MSFTLLNNQPRRVLTLLIVSHRNLITSLSHCLQHRNRPLFPHLLYNKYLLPILQLQHHRSHPQLHQLLRLLNPTLAWHLKRHLVLNLSQLPLNLYHPKHQTHKYSGILIST